MEKAISNLKKAGKLTPQGILSLSEKVDAPDSDSLPELIRPSGYYNQKAKKLRIMVKWVMDRCGGDLNKLESESTTNLRTELLGINGIGPETADSILLYALNRPVFVVDTYTRRSMHRIGICEADINYRDLQNLFISNLPEDVDLYNDFHAQIIMLGKYHCKPKPICENCHLAEICGFSLNNIRSER